MGGNQRWPPAWTFHSSGPWILQTDLKEFDNNKGESRKKGKTLRNQNM